MKEKQKTYNEITTIVAQGLYYFLHNEKICSLKTAAEVNAAIDGWVRKYQNDIGFYAHVNSLTSHLCQYYDRLTTNLQQARERIEELEQRICDECTDAEGWPTGWKENRVEGRHACGCITEAEPYQVLESQLAAQGERVRELEKAHADALELYKDEVEARKRTLTRVKDLQESLNDIRTAAFMIASSLLETSLSEEIKTTPPSKPEHKSPSVRGMLHKERSRM